MSRWWKVFVPVALAVAPALPLAVYVAGSLVTSTEQTPAPDTIVIRDSTSSPATGAPHEYAQRLPGRRHERRGGGLLRARRHR